MRVLKKMKVKTIADLQTAIQQNYPVNDGVMQFAFSKYNAGEEALPSFEWLYPYCTDVDHLLYEENKSMEIVRGFRFTSGGDDMQAKTTRLKMYLQSFFRAHQYEIVTLIATTEFEYSPIDNVSEDTIETYQGNGTEKGGQNRKLGYGTDQTRTNENIGSRVDSGSSSGSQNKGKTAGQFTLSNNVAPYDDDIFHSDTQNINNHSEDASVDTTSTTTNTTQGAQENSYTTTRNAHDDTDSLNIDMANTTSYTKHIIRHGNIGVTSSQQLIESEREIAHFSICEEIRRLFASACLIQVYNTDCEVE